MKALDEYFLMVVFTLLLNRVHVSAPFMFNFNRETRQWNFQITFKRFRLLFHLGAVVQSRIELIGFGLILVPIRLFRAKK